MDTIAELEKVGSWHTPQKLRLVSQIGNTRVCAYGYVCVCVAVCCSVLQCVAVCCSLMQCVAVTLSTFATRHYWFIAVRCSVGVVKRVAVCGSVL